MTEEDYDVIDEDEVEDVEAEDTEDEPQPADPEPEKEPEKELIVDDPYDWFQCQIHVGVDWLPVDGHDLGRLVIVSGRTHMDVPIIRTAREGEMDLLEIIGDIRHELEMSLEDRERAYQERKKEEKAKPASRVPTRSTYTPPTPVPDFHPDLFKDHDALVAMNTSEKALKMLRELVRYKERTYKEFKKSWKDQPVLELLVMNLIDVKDEKVTITEKGRAMYDVAMAWKPSAKPATETQPVEKTPEKAEKSNQLGMF